MPIGDYTLRALALVLEGQVRNSIPMQHHELREACLQAAKRLREQEAAIAALGDRISDEQAKVEDLEQVNSDLVAKLAEYRKEIADLKEKNENLSMPCNFTMPTIKLLEETEPRASRRVTDEEFWMRAFIAVFIGGLDSATASADAMLTEFRGRFPL